MMALIAFLFDVQVDRLQPKRCSGCGALLQTEEEAAIGYVPKAKFAEFSGMKTLHSKLQTGQSSPLDLE